MSGKHLDIEHWSRIACEWTTWARAPNHDEFWAYRASLLAFIGQGAGDALDVGCGEGRVSRVLKECGYRVTAINPGEKLISAAEQAGSFDRVNGFRKHVKSATLSLDGSVFVA